DCLVVHCCARRRARAPTPRSLHAALPISDAQVVFGVACAYAGKPYTCTGAEDWKQAAKLVLKTKQRPNFNGFMDNTPMLRQLARSEEHTSELPSRFELVCRLLLENIKQQH